MLGAAAAGPLVAGAGGSRGGPRGARFALLAWHRAWAWALAFVWHQVWAVMLRQFWPAAQQWAWVVAGLCVAAWRQVWVLAGLRPRA